MTELTQTRRGAILTALAAGVGATTTTGAQAAPQAGATNMPTGHENDWDWLVGSWKVRHSRLKARLAGNTEWEAFDGSCTMVPTMGGLGNMDDNVLEMPTGTYNAMGVRAFDAKSGEWLIWWLDGRNPTSIEPPVRGGFKDGVGTFVGDDTHNGKPIKVRFRWTQITPTSAHWDQAYSPDGGATWETNWNMAFTRA